MPAFLYDDKTKTDPQKFSDLCNWQTCLGYDVILKKIDSSQSINELVAKIEDIEELQNNQHTVVPTVCYLWYPIRKLIVFVGQNIQEMQLQGPYIETTIHQAGATVWSKCTKHLVS